MNEDQFAQLQQHRVRIFAHGQGDFCYGKPSLGTLNLIMTPTQDHGDPSRQRNLQERACGLVRKSASALAVG